MRLYQRTTRAAARAIIAYGFRNSWGYYLTDRLWYGVWLSDRPLASSDRPLASNEDAGGDTLLAVELDVPDAELAEYAWVDVTKPYREFLLPADLLNDRATVHVVEQEEQA